jgi:hypothetical protein
MEGPRFYRIVKRRHGRPHGLGPAEGVYLSYICTRQLRGVPKVYLSSHSI